MYRNSLLLDKYYPKLKKPVTYMNIQCKMFKIPFQYTTWSLHSDKSRLNRHCDFFWYLHSLVRYNLLHPTITS